MSTPLCCRRCGGNHDSKDAVLCPIHPHHPREHVAGEFPIIPSASGSTPVVTAEPPPRELVVVARNPQEMMLAQRQLVEWAERRVSDAKQEHEDLAENLATARAQGWRSEPLMRSVQRAHRRVEYYDKIRLALDAGYVIVPNMPVDVFAIRTDRRRPKRNERYASRVTHSWERPNQTAPQQPGLLPAGEGDYRNPITQDREVDRVMEHLPGKDPVYAITRWADEFKEIDFPFATAQPAVLAATSQALALKLFDDVGVSPATQSKIVTPSPVEVRGDPMVIGRILMRGTSPASPMRAVSFLVTWFVDSRDL